MKHNFLFVLLGLVFIVFLADKASADDNGSSPSYSYIEFSAIEYDMDVFGLDFEPEGDKIKLSVELGDTLFATVDRVETDQSFRNRRLDFDSESYGFGLRGDSWFASYTYNTWDMGRDEFDVDTIRLGFRNYLIQDRLEFNASYTWNNIEHADNEDGFQVGFVFELTDIIHITAEYETIGGDLDIEYTSVGLRLSF
jgi:hypothetical protein